MAAGAFAMVLKLGEPEVALRMLGPALEQKDVDANTAAWVIDSVLLEPNMEKVGEAAREHAVFLLLGHHDQFVSDHIAGSFNWPSCMVEAWPSRLNANAGALAIFALTDLLTSRPRAWWTREGGGWDWALGTLYAAVRDGQHEQVKILAASTLRAMMDADPQMWAGHWLTGQEFQDVVRRWVGAPVADSRRQRLRSWMREEKVAQPTVVESTAELQERSRPKP
ncbi:hypothetical protein [Serinicoccus sp. LYQ131]|uniref:hypothetical protein n=1 Tax=Serinicoccus sp. LYQ131 TaxID=3378797 RepID=UPI0038543DE7